MTRAVITVIGKDSVGIIAKICTYLANKGINILDISQTTVQEFFNMMMVVDVSSCQTALGDIPSELDAIGKETGVQITFQLEDLFDKMYRRH